MDFAPILAQLQILREAYVPPQTPPLTEFEGLTFRYREDGSVAYATSSQGNTLFVKEDGSYLIQRRQR